MKIKRKNGGLLLSLSIALIVIILLGVTLAFYRDVSQKFSPIEFGKIQINTNESFTETITLKDALPGDEITDEISFSLDNGSSDAYIRVRYEFVSDSSQVDDLLNELNNSDLELYSGDNYNWSHKFNGCYYLTTKSNDLELFNVSSIDKITFAEAVTLPSDIVQDRNYSQYMQDVRLVVEIQALQSQGLNTDLFETSEVFVDLFGGESVYTDVSEFTFNRTQLTGYTGTDKNVVIPTSYSVVSTPSNANGASASPNSSYVQGDQYKVTSIAQNAFKDNNIIENVWLPNSCTSLGNYAFQNCKNLKGVYNTVNLSSIGSSAFQYCYSLNHIDDLTGVTTVNSNAFSGCYKLESITFGEKLRTLSGMYIFQNCYNLREANFDSNCSLTTLPLYLFYSCRNLKSFTIPSNVTTISDNCFYYSGLESISIPNKVNSIGSSAFAYSGELTEVVFAEDSPITVIPNQLFRQCSSLREITLPANITTLSSSAFSACYSLSDVIFSNPSSLTTIQDSVFSYTNIVSFTIPENVTSISSNAFNNHKLVQIYNKSNVSINLPYSYQEVSTNGTFENTLSIENGIYITYQLKDSTTKYLLGVSEPTLYLNNIPTDVTHIIERAFYGNQDISFVEIPSNVTNVESYAFCDCSELLQVIFESACSFSSSLFSNCNKLVQVKSVSGSTSNFNNIQDKFDYEYVNKSDVELKNNFTIENGYIYYITPNYKHLMRDLNNREVVDNIAEDTTSIYNSAFSQKYELVSVSLPKSIKRLGNSAFSYNYALKYVNLASLDTIGSSSFYNCFNLTIDKLPDTLVDLGSSVFYNCFSLSGEIIIPKSITEIPANLFSGCSNIEKITMSDRVTRINSSAFANCSSLVLINLPSKIEYIGNSAFTGCSNLTSKFTLPNTLTYIGSNAFNGCEQLDVRNIPASVTETYGNAFTDTMWYNEQPEGILYLGDWCLGYKGTPEGTINLDCKYIAGSAFSGCNKITEFILSDNVLKIMSSAFQNCNGITNINMSSNLEYLGNSAFNNCTKLTSIELPTTLTYIGNSAFFGCSILETVNIPENVEYIGSSAFRNCTLLSTINYNAINCADFTDNNYYGRFGNVGTVTEDGTTIKIGGSVEYIPASFTAKRSNDTAHNIKVINFEPNNNFVTIGSNAFINLASDATIYFNLSNCQDFTSSTKIFDGTLTSIVFGDNVTRIPNYLLYSCTGLSNVELPNSINTIGSYAFSGCTNLNIDKLPDSINTIGQYAFSNCKALQNITLPDNLIVNRYAFQNCTGLTSITLPASVENWTGGYYFSGCTNLTTILLPDNIKTIPYGLFAGSSIKSITLPESITTIGNYAFSGCNSLTEINIPSNVTSIGNYAFNVCRNLSKIDYQAINCDDFDNNNYVFSNISKNVTTGAVINIGSKVTRIPKYFLRPTTSTSSYVSNYMPNVTEINFEQESVCTEIGDYAFSYLQNLKSVNIPKSVVKIGNYAYSYCVNVTTINFDAISCTELPTNRDHFSSIGSNATGIVLNIGANVEVLSDNIFYGCSKVNSVNFDSQSKLKAIGSYAISGGYVTEIVIPSSVEVIKSYAFSGCSNLTNITLNSLPKLHRQSFSNTKWYNSFANTDIMYLGDYCLGYKSSSPTGELILKDTCTAIADYAFQGASGITSVVLPTSLTSIGEGAFLRCTSLRGTINISDSINYIGGGAFTGTNITSIIIDSNNPNFVNGDSAKSIIDNGNVFIMGANDTITVPEGIEEIAPYALAYTTIKAITLPSTLKVIGDYAFGYCYSLKSVEIPEGVVTIGNNAFRDCRALEEIELPNTLKSLGGMSLYYCNALKSLTIPKNVTYLGSSIISQSYYLNEINYNAINASNVGSGSIFSSFGRYADDEVVVNIGEDVVSLPKYLFASQSYLTKVNFNDKLQVIGDYAFSGCSAIDNLNLPESLTAIGNYTFSGCSLLEEINLPKNLTTIGNYAFNQCDKLADLMLPESLIEIGDYAFYDCENLSDITINKCLESIGSSAFSGCTNVSTIKYYAINCTSPGSNSNTYPFNNVGLNIDNSVLIIANTVENIDEYMFAKIGVKTVKFEAESSVSQLGNGTFYQAQISGELIIPESVTEIGGSAFYNTNITSLTILGSVQTIQSFSNCDNLISVNIAEGAEKLSSNAFQNCTNLTSISLPSTISEISSSSLNNCGKLYVLCVTQEVAELAKNTNFNVVTEDKILVKVDKELYGAIWMPINESMESTIIYGVTYYRDMYDPDTHYIRA